MISHFGLRLKDKPSELTVPEHLPSSQLPSSHLPPINEVLLNDYMDFVVSFLKADKRETTERLEDFYSVQTMLSLSRAPSLSKTVQPPFYLRKSNQTITSYPLSPPCKQNYVLNLTSIAASSANLPRTPVTLTGLTLEGTPITTTLAILSSKLEFGSINVILGTDSTYELSGKGVDVTGYYQPIGESYGEDDEYDGYDDLEGYDPEYEKVLEQAEEEMLAGVKDEEEEEEEEDSEDDSNLERVYYLGKKKGYNSEDTSESESEEEEEVAPPEPPKPEPKQEPEKEGKKKKKKKKRKNSGGDDNNSNAKYAKWKS
ncbi:hypothetical protein TrLO_g12413 [Triparma laevis f. longispina]|uniref:Nucleoplasmin-like domain-containing protein n=1 Tax=Triparma laevis f. longispina TaxID=1714387 RepID=A0A9W7B3A8_9STRA|nr:hypothetical protein TrLO_g12413 [Triparma laevis f. longispina]